MELGQGEVFRVLHEQLVELHEADTALLPRALVGVQPDADQVWSLKQFASVCFFTIAIRGGVVMGGSRRARAPQFLEQHREVRAIFIGLVEKAAVILPW